MNYQVYLEVFLELDSLQLMTLITLYAPIKYRKRSRSLLFSLLIFTGNLALKPNSTSLLNQIKQWEIQNSGLRQIIKERFLCGFHRFKLRFYLSRINTILRQKRYTMSFLKKEFGLS